MQSSQSRSLVDWLSYLEQIHPVNIDMGLDRVGAVARRMGLTELPFKVITVAGTNGKGSSCAMAASILMAAGYRVGVYSSPHLLRFTERVRIDGAELADSEHCEAFAAVETARAEIALTFFEFATLAGLWLFRRTVPDVLLLEVGLGGRLDATNVVESDVAMITSIALDHCDWLGDTREAVAVEKAGVYRAGKPAISGEPNPPSTIASEALRLGAHLRQVGVDFSVDEHADHWDYHGLHHWLNLPKPALPLMNAVTVLAALESLGLPLPETAIRQGLTEARRRSPQSSLGGLSGEPAAADPLPGTAPRRGRYAQRQGHGGLSCRAGWPDRRLVSREPAWSPRRHGGPAGDGAGRAGPGHAV